MTTVQPAARAATLVNGRLVSGEQVAEQTWLLEFALEGAPAASLPGQYYLVDCGGGREHLLRRPLSVHYEAAGSFAHTLVFLVESVGWGTARLCSLGEGEDVSMLGPLGVPFELPAEGKTLLVAGGMGIAPLYLAARRLDESGRQYDLLAGFAAGARVCHCFDGLGGELLLYTDDGSEGRQGMVSEGVAPMLDERAYDAVLVCGPEAMMRSVSALCEQRGVPCQVSLVARMACGVGACRGCVRGARDGGNLCVCSDGPVFDSRVVAWHTGRA